MILEDIIDAGVKLMMEKDDLMPHFIYCEGGHWTGLENLNEIIWKAIILKKMEKYGIQSSILTGLSMRKENLITQFSSLFISSVRI